MKTIQQIHGKVEFILSQSLDLPEPNNINQEYLSFKTRCCQAESFGLDRMSLCEVAQLITKKNYKWVRTWWGWDGRTGKWDLQDRQKYKEFIFEYFYDSFFNATWAGMALEPLFVKGIFAPTLMLSRLHDHNVDCPHSTFLKMNQLKELKLFNCFSILGPKNAFRSSKKFHKSKYISVLLGVIYNLNYTPNGNNDPNYVAYYPLAKWG
jgi:hypothetical protein